ncbi:MAG: transcription-repair coupling factor [Desulfobacterium sp.]|nr:transcription-repair coupling factor [Desulfobacterium sp.]
MTKQLLPKQLPIKQLSDTIAKRQTSLDLTGVHGSGSAYITAKLFASSECSLVVVLPDRKRALEFMDELEFYLPRNKRQVIYFPGYNILPFKALSFHAETAARRVAALYRLISRREHHILVTCVDTLLLKVIPKKRLAHAADLVVSNEEIDRDLLVARLNAGGYIRTSLVEEPGDYSVRGGILDLFSPSADFPVRMELFGDYVESLRFFSPVTQRGIKDIQEIEIIPANEAVVDPAQLPEILGRLRRAGADAGVDPSLIRDLVDKIREHGRFTGMEGMLSIVYPELDSLIDYFPGQSLILLEDPLNIEASAIEFEEKAGKNYTQALAENRLSVPPESLYTEWSRVKSRLFEQNPLSFKRLTMDKRLPDSVELSLDLADNSFLSSALKGGGKTEGLLQPLADWFIEKKNSGMRAVAVCSSTTHSQRLVSLLRPYGVEPLFLKDFSEVEARKPGIYCIPGYSSGSLTRGFVSVELGLALVTNQEIFGVKRRRSAGSTRRAKSQFITPEELKDGDIVVHLEHGLGRYDGLVTLKLDGITGDFILISFRDDDRLYLPVDRMEMVEKYIGVDGYSPILDKIGGKTWQKSRAKAKKEVEKMAGELLKLYAERRVAKGFAFSRPDHFFNEFEATFPYEETPDQLKAIDDVLDDMASETPMDRLVCGDVGYGKTEVAIRAAFKAVTDGKQVAIVVPTTILAEQHVHTFRDRFTNYPINVESLSRFRTKGEQARIVKDLEQGKLDVVIGTHRLLQKDIAFKALGLLVIDEEQRFGVRHKEALKRRRSTVDVLALTATPIPRTLHMSLTGMRDISIISTPPVDRQPIVSYISEYDDSIAAGAIQKEMERGGQIFFIHNNIKTIFKTAENLKKLVPDARIGVAHGRLTEAALEKVMVQFINREIDLLVSTTIVESGLDIPSANTMIINRADMFGLSQIYQLRGRIGRGEEQAYAYLFIPEEHRLTRDAQKRLAALMEHRDLGSGFQIAMKDLQIRGAGSALGGSQSGHVAAVGYDMFLTLLDEAVADLKGEPLTDPLEPEINVTLSTFISDEYVKSIEQRLTIYRRLSQMTTVKEVAAMQQELVDRFGKLPEEAGNMLLKIMLRVLCVRAGIKKLDLTTTSLTLVSSAIHQRRPQALAGGISTLAFAHEFMAENTLRFSVGGKSKPITRALGEAKKILQTIAPLVNP